MYGKSLVLLITILAVKLSSKDHVLGFVHYFQLLKRVRKLFQTFPFFKIFTLFLLLITLRQVGIKPKT